jgi:hypothetical protein
MLVEPEAHVVIRRCAEARRAVRALVQAVE